jgi:hypothetical protein
MFASLCELLALSDSLATRHTTTTPSHAAREAYESLHDQTTPQRDMLADLPIHSQTQS